MNEQEPKPVDVDVDVEDTPAVTVVERPDEVSPVHCKPEGEPAREDDPAQGWVIECGCGHPSRGLTPGEADARLDAHIFEREAANSRNLIDRLASFVMDRLPHEINPELGEVDVVSIMIRVLQGFIDQPNGRLEPVVRAAVDELEHIRDLDPRAEALLGTLKRALVAPPRPGGGPDPVYESDDITMVRYDRDRFRVDHDGACKTIAEMYVAATGRVGLGPQRGVVEDLVDVRLRGQAAEEALTVALRHKCDAGMGGVEPPEPGTAAYTQWHRMVVDVVSALAGQPV